ncbi:MAG: ExbD/TolR family protein [Phycisphaerales bacterium]
MTRGALRSGDGAERARRLARRARLAGRARRRRAHPMLRIAGSDGIRLNMAAMIDIVFLLLIYFMLIAEFRPDESSFVTRNALGGDTVEADPFALPERPITVRIRTVGHGDDADSAIAISTDSPVFEGSEDLDGFRATAERAFDRLLGADQPFVVIPSPSTRWAHALALVNALSLAGYESIQLEDPETSNPEAAP